MCTLKSVGTLQEGRGHCCPRNHDGVVSADLHRNCLLRRACVGGIIKQSTHMESSILTPSQKKTTNFMLYFANLLYVLHCLLNMKKSLENNGKIHKLLVVHREMFLGTNGCVRFVKKCLFYKSYTNLPITTISHFCSNNQVHIVSVYV